MIPARNRFDDNIDKRLIADLRRCVVSFLAHEDTVNSLLVSLHSAPLVSSFPPLYPFFLPSPTSQTLSCRTVMALHRNASHQIARSPVSVTFLFSSLPPLRRPTTDFVSQASSRRRTSRRRQEEQRKRTERERRCRLLHGSQTGASRQRAAFYVREPGGKKKKQKTFPPRSASSLIYLFPLVKRREGGTPGAPSERT